MTKPRTTKHGAVIAPSILRPKVLAKDRLLLWSTSYTQNRNSTPFKLPEHIITRTTEVLASAYDDSTKKNYGGGIARFIEFCDNNNIPEDQRVPASDELLAGFISSWTGQRSDDTMRSWLSGLQAWHTINRAPWLFGPLCKTTMKGARKQVPDSSRRTKRPPVTYSHMVALQKKLNTRNSFDAAVFTMACTAFWGVCRLGELAPRSAKEFDKSIHVSRNCDFQIKVTSENDIYATFTVPRTKTSSTPVPFSLSDIKNDPLSPISALENHFKRNSNPPVDSPLFAYKTATGWSPLSVEWFMQRCNTVWSEENLITLTGHCFRIGGATELLLRGVPPEVVMAQGRWSSDAFLRYWRKIDEILPLFIGSALHKESHSSLAGRIANFRSAL